MVGTTGMAVPLIRASLKQRSITSTETNGRTPSCMATKPCASSGMQERPFFDDAKRVSPPLTTV